MLVCEGIVRALAYLEPDNYFCNKIKTKKKQNKETKQQLKKQQKTTTTTQPQNHRCLFILGYFPNTILV